MPKSNNHQTNTEFIIDSITEGVFTTDLDRNITSFNKSAERITGFTKEEALGSKCFEIFKANICESNCFLRQTISSGKNIFDRRINILNKEGKIIPISVNTALLKSPTGEIIGGVETFLDRFEIELLKKQIEKSYTFEDIIGKSLRIQEIMSILPDIAKSSSTVLLQGPSGSGKEIFARAIHNLSNRKREPFVTINCGAIPGELLESELFGYVKGAFTDAKNNKPGKFKLAGNGTILLDEIGDLPPLLQVKLLRVIQEKEYEPVGGVESYKTNARLVLATNRNLHQLVAEGKFRDDLYFRINVVKLLLPSLSERREDIPLLLSHFITTQNHIAEKEIKNVSKEVMQFFMNYSFPGNIRELQNIIEYAFILCHGTTIEMQHLPREVISPEGPIAVQNNSNISFAQVEAEVIKKALGKNKWNRGDAARELGINPTTLWRKMKKYNII